MLAGYGEARSKVLIVELGWVMIRLPLLAVPLCGKAVRVPGG
jgi:hypothetical protein